MQSLLHLLPMSFLTNNPWLSILIASKQPGRLDTTIILMEELWNKLNNWWALLKLQIISSYPKKIFKLSLLLHNSSSHLNNGLNATPLEKLEINLLVDLAGLSELSRQWVTEFALKANKLFRQEFHLKIF